MHLKTYSRIITIVSLSIAGCSIVKLVKMKRPKRTNLNFEKFEQTYFILIFPSASNSFFKVLFNPWKITFFSSLLVLTWRLGWRLWEEAVSTIFLQIALISSSSSLRVWKHSAMFSKNDDLSPLSFSSFVASSIGKKVSASQSFQF